MTYRNTSARIIASLDFNVNKNGSQVYRIITGQERCDYKVNKNDRLRIFEISRMFGVLAYTCTCRSVIKNFQEQGSLLNAKKAGRPKNYSVAEKQSYFD